MARLERAPKATAQRMLHVHNRRCPECGKALWSAYVSDRTVRTLAGVHRPTRASFDLHAEHPTVTVEVGYPKHRRRDVLPLRVDTAAELQAFWWGRGPLLPRSTPPIGTGPRRCSARTWRRRARRG
jgi:hypothetical protein